MKKTFKEKLYELWHGHPFLLDEEVDIICNTRFDEHYKWMNDSQIQKLIKIRVKEMYKKKFPSTPNIVKRFLNYKFKNLNHNK
jgi:hypothetical protein